MSPQPPSLAEQLATWACDLRPTADDLALADRSLRDTLAVAIAARHHPVTRVARSLSEGGRWAAAAHVLDFDDLHMESTVHISAVCVPAVVASGGDARAYLAAGGVMARLGGILGWNHYSAGWHATCTAGAPAAAVGAAIAMKLDPRQVATAMALAVPGAGGVQRAFGSDAKSLQVAFAVETGLRAARLAAAGAQANPTALETWCSLVGAPSPDRVDLSGPAVPGGLAIKIYPCCYALQRPISAIASLRGQVKPEDVELISLRTPRATVTPLIHHRPTTGLQGKFSLEYAVATALLDRHQGFDSFSDAAVQRPAAQALIDAVDIVLEPGGNWLLAGTFEGEIHLRSGRLLRCAQQYPPGSPHKPPSDADFDEKLRECLRGVDTDPAAWTWPSAAETLRGNLDVTQ